MSRWRSRFVQLHSHQKLSIATSPRYGLLLDTQPREKYTHKLALKFTWTLVILESLVMEYKSIENYQ